MHTRWMFTRTAVSSSLAECQQGTRTSTEFISVEDLDVHLIDVVSFDQRDCGPSSLVDDVASFLIIQYYSIPMGCDRAC